MKKILVLMILAILSTSVFMSCRDAKEEKSETEELVEEMKADGAEMKVKKDGDETKIKMETEDKEVKIKTEDGETKIKVETDSDDS